MPEISIIVPTFSEADNVLELHARLASSLAAEDWELIFVDDDSPDGTADVVRALANIGIAAYAFAQRTEWALSAAAGILVGMLWNYLVTARFTWSAARH